MILSKTNPDITCYFITFTTGKKAKMVEQFETYRENNGIFTPDNMILAGVSGGIDSIVMLDMFLEGHYNVAVAHCNFQLRGEESDEDEKFVKDICRRHSLKLHTQRFNTTEYAANNRLSIQMAARELRFRWMFELLEEEKYDLLSLGHNLNDSIETMIINLSRGTGLNGLTGISCRSGSVIRPILFATREMIKDYASSKNLEYREDSSNSQTRYTRNKIRHRVLPVLEEINPSILRSLEETSEYLQSAYIIYEQAIRDRKDQIIESDGKFEYCIISELRKLSPLNTWIYEIFKGWNFRKQQVNDILRLIDGDTGKQVYGKSHTITRDRDRLLISPVKKDLSKPVLLNSYGELRNSDFFKKVEILPANSIKLSDDSGIAHIDADLIKYPLTIRKWEDGDYFYPLGMKGRKKVSDLLIDMKIPLPEKEDIHIIESEDNIIWVIGLRIDDRFKISKSTRDVMILHIS